MTRAQKHMGKVASLGCVVCRRILRLGYTPCEVHHAFDSSDRSDWLVLPLCSEHHRGATGFHGLGERAFNARYKTSETKLLGMTIDDLSRIYGS